MPQNNDLITLPKTIDLNQRAQTFELTVKSVDSPAVEAEKKAEGEQKRELERLAAEVERKKDLALFLVTVALIAGVAALCAYVFLGNRFSQEDKKWSGSILGLILGALIAYLTKKPNSPKQA